MRKIDYSQAIARPYLQQESKTVVIPSPTGGWNAILPLAAMDPQYAAILQNWVPRTGWVEVRPGYAAWTQGVSSTTVESLMVYRSGAGEKLFAATNAAIYDVSLSGSAILVQSGMTNSRWQYVNFTPTQGSSYLVICNGQDGVLEFNGTTWSTPSITGGPSPNTFINVAAWKRRLWFVQANTTMAWYLGTDAIQGSLLTGGNPNVVDIGPYIMKGGFLVAIGTLTIDGGNGPDDLICFFSNKGEVVIYKGTDPTNASAFSLVGVFYLAPPLGNRCLMDYGADLAVITLQGVIPLSQALPVDTDAVRGVALTNKIQNTMLLEAAMAQSNFGWEMTHFPAQGLIILNVPINTGNSQQQYVMNALTGAWCQFTGWSANTFAIYNNNLYFGDNIGNVNQAWVGSADLVNPIVADMQCAFNYFGDPGKLKEITMVQPLMVTSGMVTPTLGIDVDFGSVSPTANVQTVTPSGAEFGFSIFGTATFAAGTSQQILWQGARGLGKALALRVKVNLAPGGAGSQSIFDTGVFDTMIFDGVGTQTTTVQLNMANAIMRYAGAI